MRVVDNGCGILAEELPLAVAAMPRASSPSRRSVPRRHARLPRRSLGIHRRDLPLGAAQPHRRGDQGGAEFEVAGGHVGEVVTVRLPGGHDDRGP